MYPDTRSRLVAARTALVLGPVIAGISVIFQPDLGGSTADRFDAMSSSVAARSAAAFVGSQLPLLVGFLAIGRLLLPSAPKLSASGAALAVAGCFGHAVFGGASLVFVMMARDETHRGVQVALFDQIQGSPIMVFAALGLLGTVLGLLLLGIGLFRTRTGPAWVGPVIWAFLLVEFVGSSVSRYASYVSVLLLAAAFFAIAGLLEDDAPRGTAPAREPAAQA